MNGSRPSRPVEGFSDILWKAVENCWVDPNYRHTSTTFMNELLMMDIGTRNCSDVQKEDDLETDLLKQLVLVYDYTEEEISGLRTRVDAWLEARESDEVGSEAMN